MGVSSEEGPVGTKAPWIWFCEEKQRLSNEFLAAVSELSAIQGQQTQAVIDGDSDFARFDVLLHLAQEKKERAKYAWIAHVEEHHCGEGEQADETITS
jgi:hypothetical protein